jgi:hypothetical protein
MVAITAGTQMTTNTLTADVDHGMAAAISAGYTSTPRSPAHERTIDPMIATIPVLSEGFSTVSDMSYTVRCGMSRTGLIAAQS